MQDLYASSSSAQLQFLSAQSLPFSCLVSYFLLINCQGIYSKKFPAAKKKQKTIIVWISISQNLINQQMK
jgi:hypothetical protein